MRLDERAAVGQQGVQPGDLQRCDLEIALPDRLQHGIARRPAVVHAVVTETLPLVGVVGDAAGRVAADIDAGRRTEAEAARPQRLRLEVARLRRGVVETLAELVEVGIARDHQGLQRVHRLVHAGLEVAVDLPVDLHLRGALDLAVGPHEPCCASGDRRHRLERRARRVEAIERAVEQRRVIGVLRQLTPVAVALGARQDRRVEARVRCHRADRPSAGIHRHNRAAFDGRVAVGAGVADRLAQRVLRGGLDAGVDRQPDVVAGLGGARTDD